MLMCDGNERNAGFTNFFTTNRSVILEIIGSTEIGLKSDGVVGFLILGTGLIKAHFHWFGT